MFGFKQQRRVEALEEDLRKLKRDFESLELEWTNVYDKLRKVMGRIVKSRAVIEEKENEVLGDDGGERGPTGLVPSPGFGGYLTPRQRVVQQQILKRRGGIG